jgi:quercetin dioxygenase-like cupin family protein
MTPSLRTLSVFLATLVAAPASLHAFAEPTGMVSTPLLRTTVSGDDRREALIGIAELAPGGSTGRHSHPGDEYATVLQGTLELRVDGREARRLGAGEAYHNPRGVIHETRNVGDDTARVLSTFILDKGQPLMQPAR